MPLDRTEQCCGVWQPSLARSRIGIMVIPIGTELVARISPSGSQAVVACARLPAVLSPRNHSIRDSSWRNRDHRARKRAALIALTAPTPAACRDAMWWPGIMAKRPAEMPEIPGTHKSLQFPPFREPRNGVI